MERGEAQPPRRGLGPRFGPEAALILAAAALAALTELSWPGVVAVVLGAWLAVAAFEIYRARSRPAVEDAEPAEPDIEAEPEPDEVVAPDATRPDSPPRAVQGGPEGEPPRVEQHS